MGLIPKNQPSLEELASRGLDKDGNVAAKPAKKPAATKASKGDK